MRSGSRWRAWQLIASFVACAATSRVLADDLKPEVLLLARFKQKVRQDVARLAYCTCLETIERSEKPPASDEFQFLDRVRLEVTHAGEKELLTWPGGNRFEDRDAKSFVNGGLVAVGTFASQARNVFVGEQSIYRYVGPEDLDGRHTVRFDFRIPALAGAYKLGSGGKSAWVASKGSFWIDPVSLALLRLDAMADEIPPGLDISATLTRIHYALLHTGTVEFLAPETADILLTHTSGDARRDSIRYTQCREYKAQSSISFEAPAPDAASGREEFERVDLPAGLTIPMQLDDGLDGSTAAVGDPVHAHVTRDIRRSGSLLLPKGALATGRVRTMERRRREGGFLIGLELTEFRWDKNRAAFHAQLLDAQTVQIKTPRKESDAGNMTGLTSGSMQSEAAVQPQPAVGKGKGVQTPGLCTLWLKEEHWHLATGMTMVWRTLAP